MDKAKLLNKTLVDVWEKTQWIEPLCETLKDIATAEANWRPAPGVQPIVDIVNHMAYWIDLCNREFQDISIEPLMPFPSRGEPPDDMPSWPKALKNLNDKHEAFQKTLAAMTDEDFDRKFPKLRRTASELALGEICHDSYHAGQIYLIRQLWAAQKKKT